MAGLTATFKLVDEMSDKLSNIASGGQEMVSRFEEMGNAADNFFSQINEGSESAVKAVDEISSSFEGYENSVRSAAESAGYWTDAVGSYDKSALEAIYTTEELVDMGLKVTDALIEEGEMLGICETAAASLNKEIEFSVDAQSELNSVMQSAEEIIKGVSENENVSAEMKRELANASEQAAKAMDELVAAESAAREAMDNYDSVIISGTTDLGKLNEAAGQAKESAEKLSEANKKAGQATEELGKASKEAAEECEKAGKSGSDAFENIAAALAAAGITALVKDIAAAAYELADAFSEAESTVVKATGAAGEMLDELNSSMMDAYAAAKSGDGLDDVSGAIGEINTRIGLMGDKLTEVTGQFLDFSNITGTDVVGSVQNVTKIMNKWGVEGKNVESVLDKLSFAGQVSGISVNTLASNLISGAAIFQEAGLSLDNAVSMLADFELAGINGTTAITAMRTAVKNFSSEGLDAETALASVINEISNMGNEAEATALAVEIFGSRAGIDMANAIKNGVITVESFTGSLDKASGTLDKTAKNSQTLEQKWQQASNGIKAAFTTAIQPTVDGISSKFADITKGVGDFLNKHPLITKAITAIGAGIGVVAGAFAAISAATVVYNAAMAVSTAFTAAFGVTLSAAIWPITAVAAAVAAVVGVVSLLSDAFASSGNEMEGMTETTKEQYNDLQELNAEYEKLSETHEENETEMLRLKSNIDDLTISYEANKQSVEELVAECEELIKSSDEVMTSYNDSMKEMRNQEIGTLSLIQKLDDLVKTNDKTEESETQIKNIIAQLNKELPELSLSYENLTSNTEAYVKILKDACEAKADEERLNKSRESYTEILGKERELEEKIGILISNKQLAEEKINKLTAERNALSYDKKDGERRRELQSIIDKTKESLEKYNKELAFSEMAQGSLLIQQTNIETMWTSISFAEEEAAKEAISYDDAIVKLTNNVKPAMEELVSEYQKVYEAARSSLDGQHDLFEKIEVKAGISSARIIETWKQQEKVFNQYNDNLRKLETIGIDKNILKELSDGSAESMGQVAALKQELNGLSSAEAAKRVEEINTSFGKLSEAKNKTATTMADIQGNFKEELDEMKKDLEKTIGDMTMDAESKEAAKITMQGYINGIYSMRNKAVSAANAVATATSAALGAGKGGNVMDNLKLKLQELGLVEHNAKGTADAADVFIAGEEGPELVVGAGGSTVFPADHTERILSAINDRDFREKPLQVDVPQSVMSAGEDKNYSYSETKSEKKISIDINGNGSVSMNGPIDKESTVNFLYENIKPVLLSILRTEIYEEGNESYVY